MDSDCYKGAILQVKGRHRIRIAADSRPSTQDGQRKQSPPLLISAAISVRPAYVLVPPSVPLHHVVEQPDIIVTCRAAYRAVNSHATGVPSDSINLPPTRRGQRPHRIFGRTTSAAGVKKRSLPYAHRAADWKDASTAASQGLSHLSSTTATSGLTSKFGKGLGRTLTLWPA